MNDTDDDIWAQGWLDRNYTGAPDECSLCWHRGEIVKIADCLIHPYPDGPIN